MDSSSPSSTSMGSASRASRSESDSESDSDRSDALSDFTDTRRLRTAAMFTQSKNELTANSQWSERSLALALHTALEPRDAHKHAAQETLAASVNRPLSLNAPTFIIKRM